ncbi:hypothetical protein [Caproiciproducens sp.]|uniref:hypothetical protein n=1 Tax=Caproiciproducens sp. TaxID=1954376 RepID=UPI0028A2603D|nr:hypothetical protein [Caproiciproducens sp.]
MFYISNCEKICYDIKNEFEVAITGTSYRGDGVKVSSNLTRVVGGFLLSKRQTIGVPAKADKKSELLLSERGSDFYNGMVVTG